MTTALCLNCGKIKFGALCICPNCNHEPEDISELDLIFTDHFLPGEFLKLLGEDLQKIRSLETNEEIAVKAFFINTKMYLNNDQQEAIEILGDTKHAEELLKKANLSKHNLDEIKTKQSRGSTSFFILITLLFLTVIYLFYKVILKMLR